MDWDKLNKKELKAPYTPEVKDDIESGYGDLTGGKLHDADADIGSLDKDEVGASMTPAQKNFIRENADKFKDF